MRQPSPNAWYGFMTFMAKPHMYYGLRYQPNLPPMWQPNDTNNSPKPTTAEEWATTYSASKDRLALEHEAAYYATLMHKMYNQIPNKTPEPTEADNVLPVAIETDGTVFVYNHTGNDKPLAIYTAAEIYAAYGLTPP